MGILNPLYDAVSWIIIQFHWLYSRVFPADSGWAWGLSIVSLVVVIRICLIPLFVKQIKATRSMQALQPQMKTLQERYKNDRQRQSEEMMKLYREAGTNPFSSCLPILVQSPFFLALYRVLSQISKGHTVGVIDQDLVNSAQKAHIFGAPLAAKFTDTADAVAKLGSSLGDVRVVTVIMIVLMSFSQFYTQRQLMTKNVDLSVKTPFMQQQKMLMYVFPVMFAVFGINFPVGVLVYWLTTNVWTMGQQMFVIRRNPTPGSKAYAARQERLKAKGKPVAAQPALEKGEPAQPRRQQPRRQTKAQRQSTGGSQSKPQTPQRAPKDAAPDEVQVTKSKEAPAQDRPRKGKGSVGAPGTKGKPGQGQGQQRRGRQPSQPAAPRGKK